MVLFRHQGIFLGTAGLVLFLALVYALAGASYRAHFRILVRRGRADPPVTGQPNAPPDFSRVEVTEEELNSEAELVQDEEVLRRVVEANDLARHDWLRWLRPHEERAARTERAAKRLANHLKVEALKKTNFIAVSYDSGDPGEAARVLQSLASIYLEKHMEVHRPAGQLQFFDQQTAASREQLERSQHNLREFARKGGVVAAAQQRDLLLQRLESLEASAGQTHVEMAEAKHRAQELETEMSKLPQRSTTQIRTADNPELLRTLKGTLLDLELKRTQLLTKYEPSHRLVQEVEGEIQQAQAAIDAERSTPTRDETTDKDSEYEWANGELEKVRVEMEALRARESATHTELRQYRHVAEQLGEAAIIQDDLASSEKAAEENYLLYVKKREEARMGDALDQGGIVNVAIAEAPVVPALPVWPVGMVILAGLVTAATAGAGAAFAADHLDPALRTPEEVFSCLDLPVLASLPAKTRTRLSA
jgi:uncharacterized protein involved in exopolysaccharide biosynthesis